AFIGYLNGVDELYRFGPKQAVALNTALGLSFLCLAILRTRPDWGWRHNFRATPVARRVFVRLVPAAVVLPVATGFAIVSGSRLGAFDLVFGVTLFAVLASGICIALIWIAARTMRSAELNLAEQTQ